MDNITPDARDVRRAEGEAQDFCPAWSPDGARIAFKANFTGVWGAKSRSAAIATYR